MSPSRIRRLLAFAALLLLLPSTAETAEVTAKTTEVTFHISHPAKEYDANLLPGGANIVGSFDPNDLAQTGFDVSIRIDKFNSNNSRRDSHMMEVMEGLIFPKITWKVDGLEGVSGPIKAGSYKAYASGPLTVHGVKQNTDIQVELTIDAAGNITVTASFSVSLESFGIERPTLVFVPIEDEVPIKVKVVFPGGSAVLAPESPPAPAAAPPAE